MKIEAKQNRTLGRLNFLKVVCDYKFQKYISIFEYDFKATLKTNLGFI